MRGGREEAVGRVSASTTTSDPELLPLGMGAARVPSPRVLIDAGDLAWPQLVVAVRRALAGLAPGEALEVASSDPQTLEILPGWCEDEGHTLIHRQPGDGFISFWIGKNG